MHASTHARANLVNQYSTITLDRLHNQSLCIQYTVVQYVHMSQRLEGWLALLLKNKQNKKKREQTSPKVHFCTLLLFPSPDVRLVSVC